MDHEKCFSRMKYYIVDAFTREPFGGNPAGVVLLDGAFPSDELMQQVAAELRYSETAFVQQQGPEEFTVRYFTPAGEVDLCGHATIAAFVLLHRFGIVSEGATCLNHTLAGDLKVKIDTQVMIQMAPPMVVNRPFDAERLHRIMTGGRNEAVWPEMPVEIISTGLPDIILPVASLEALNDLRPDMDLLAAYSTELDVVGVHAFAFSNDNYTAHVRNFAPRYDIPEESATGTANAALTHYLQRHEAIAAGDSCHFLQGEAMARPSIVMTTLARDGDIWVGGECCLVAEGKLLL